MKKMFSIIGIVIAVLLIIGFIFWFVFGGGMLFIPNPPTPAIKSAEFNFTLTYEIGGEVRTLSDTLVCEFDGFNIDEGRGKTRRWKKYYKNMQNNKLFDDSAGNPKHYKPKYDKILLQNIEPYKIVLATASAEYFLGEPEYKRIPEMPYIQVFDTNTGYYKDSEQSELFLDEHGFKVIGWYCDSPIENTFNEP